ncbi:uncharacterized protein LOC128855831 [Anastrepha ludens]|uniref:uncharacterized protein LOC128855831 n=1 Tax=Anastrepha ludens TaxID=28586 RepID=UPI0023B1B4BE|nr:uncharacterized protein LOC128855831 [Anastrepha ludens]
MLKAALSICTLLMLWSANAAEGERNRKRNEVSRYMNLHAHPCLDFYEFACGSWEQPYIDTKYMQPVMENPEIYLRTKIDHDLRNLLQEQTKLEDGVNGRKLKDFYKSCITVERNNLIQQEYFSQIIEAHGGFPAVPGSKWQSHNYNWPDMVGTLRFQYGMNILVGVKIDLNYLYPYEDSIYLVEPDTFIPPELCSEEATNRTTLRAEEYAIIENEVAENLNMWLSLDMEKSQKIATELVAFEYQLCAGVKRKHANQPTIAVWQSYDSDIRKTLYDFTHHFENKIDFIAATFGTPIHKPVYMAAEPYFRQLIKLIAASNKSTIANYIMYQTLLGLSLPHNDQPNIRALHCVEKAKRYFPQVLGEMFYRNHVNVAARDDVLNMFDKLKESFRMSLQKPWIKDYTRRIAESKLAEMHLAFPVYGKMEISHININRSSYWQNLNSLMKDRQQAQFQRIFPPKRTNLYDQVESYETHIFYSPQQTRFEMGWGLLQAPLYHTEYPNSMRYAVIGHKLASLLASAFDDISWSTSTNGLLNWDHTTEFEYRNRSECFRQQVSNYLYNDPLSFSNSTLLREIVAQSAGLNVAFNAYLNWLAFLQPTDDFEVLSKETLPEFNFTNTQLFFIAFAQMHCNAAGSGTRKSGTAGPARTLSSLERHSIERFAVNGPLRNFIEFARDFGCAMGVDMNPPDKCVIYYCSSIMHGNVARTTVFGRSVNFRYVKMPRFVRLSLHLCVALSSAIALSCFAFQVAAQRDASNRDIEGKIIRNAKATEVLKYMNPLADPCNNFYEFACGKWPEHQPQLEEGDALISVQTQLIQRVQTDVQRLLDAINAKTNSKRNVDIRKIKEFYMSCLTVARSSDMQKNFLMNFVKEYNGMPLLSITNWNINYDWVQVIARLRLNYGFDFLIGMEVEKKGRAVISLTEPKTSLIPRNLCSAGSALDADKRDAISEQLQTEVSKNLQAWLALRADETDRVAGDIIRFEFELCRFMREEESLPPSKDSKPERIVYEGRDLSDLSKQFGNIINFGKYLDISLNTSTANVKIVMQSPRYFQHLARVARNNPKPTLTNYIMYRALSAINFPRDEAKYPPAPYCTELIMRYFPKFIGQLYYSSTNISYHRSAIRADLEQLFGTIKEALRETLNVDGLPENARRIFQNKLMLYETLSFPKYKNANLRDLPSLERRNFWLMQDIVMKYRGYKEQQRFYGGDAEVDENSVEYMDIQMKLEENGIVTGWGILHPPFYDYFYAKSLKYAIIGQRIARELVGAMIPDAEETEITRDESVMEAFNNISECYRMQYSNFLYNIPNEFYNTSKLRELMTDSAGLNVAFKAYLAWLESVDPSNREILRRETLPGVDFTNTQLFFISFAQSRCYAKYMSEPPPTFLPLGTHTEELFDVNGVLANNVEFAREFGCTPGAEMNPDEKCMVY